MLKIIIPEVEVYDEAKNEFIVKSKEQKLELEHSLVSISKWESKWCKPFMTKEEKTDEQTIDYIKCMTITQNVDSNVYNHLTIENFRQVREYIEADMTATKFYNNEKSGNREIITSELIYYWMISFNIPFECQKWHLNRLITLINVCNLKNAPAKKMSKQEIIKRNAELNASRRKALNSEG